MNDPARVSDRHHRGVGAVLGMALLAVALGLPGAVRGTSEEGASLDSLCAELRGADGNARRKAAEALGGFADPAAVAALAAAYRAEERDAFGVKAACASALGATGMPAAAAPLGAMLDDPDYWVRKAAATALAAVPGGEAENHLQRALGDRDPRVRAAALTSLGLRGGPEEALQRGLRDRDPRVVAAALEALCAAGSADAADTVQRFLDDPRWRPRYRAASLLAERGDPRGAVLLEQAALAGEHPRAALRELGRAGGPAVPALGRVFQGADEEARGHAFDALESVVGPEATGFFVRLAADAASPEALRVRAASVLYDRRDSLTPSDLDRVAGWLDASDPDLLAVALQILLEERPTGAAPRVLALADHENAVVRHFAIANLAASGGVECEGVFVRALTDANGANVRLALDALGRVGTAKAVPAIRPLQEDRKLKRFATAAIEAIEQRGQ